MFIGFRSVEGAEARIATPLMSFSNVSHPELRFHFYYLDMSDQDLQFNDHMIVEISVDGQPFVPVEGADYYQHDANTRWTEVVLPLTDYAGSEKVSNTLAEAEKRVFDLAQRGGGSEFVPIRQVVINVMKKIDAASRARGRVTGLETGFMDLDYKTSGLQPSDLVLIAARPSMGKTAFVLNLAQHMAFKREQAVAIFSLEMSKEQLVNRMLSLESHVDAQKIRTGRLNDEEWMNLVEGSANIAASRLFIDDTPGITLPVMRSKCRKLKMEHDIQIVIIDYLQLMSGDNNSNASSRQQEISDISRGLKALARELNVPVVALSQLSRAVEQRPDHRPMLSDLRESGAIEQDADVVMFLYREGYYNRDLSEAEQRVAEVIIAKQRNGPIGTVNLLWIPELTKFTDMDREPGPQ